jgi:transposase-like protein
VDHVTGYRWVLRFTPLLADAARACRHAVGDRWQVDQTYVKVAGWWRYVYRAIDQFGQVIDSTRCHGRPPVLRAGHRHHQGQARRGHHRSGTGVSSGIGEAAAGGVARTDRYANNRVEADHGRLKAWLPAMRGLKQDRSTRVVLVGHAFVQNLRRGHYELAVEEPAIRRLTVAFDELALVI